MVSFQLQLHFSNSRHEISILHGKHVEMTYSVLHLSSATGPHNLAKIRLTGTSNC